MVGICLFYVGGIFLGWSLGVTSFHLYYLYFPLVFLFLTAVFSFLKRKLRFSNILIYICILFLGTVAYSLKTNAINPRHISNFIQGEEEKKKVILEGTVIKDPEVRAEVVLAGEDAGADKEQKMERRTILILRAERMKREKKWGKVVGLMQISIRGKDAVGDYGQKIRIVGMLLRKPPLPNNPGEFDYRRYLARKGIYAAANVYPGQVKVLGTGRINPFVKAALSIKDRMKTIIEGTMKYPGTVLLKGILLGERGDVPEDIKEVFTRTGTVHILAISGLHVGLVIFIFLMLFRSVRIPRKIRAMLTIAVIIAYALLTGGRPPVIRASIIAIAVLSGMVINRESDLLNSLSLAALIILAFNPLELFDSGFQLSFAAVLAIIFLAPRLNNLFLKNSSADSTLKSYLLKSLSVILAAQIGIIPLLAYYYSLFTPIAMVANFLIVPLLGIVVALGFSACLSGLISLPLAKLFGAANEVVLTVVVKSVDLLSHLPFAFIYVGRPRAAMVVGYYLMIGAVFYAKVPLIKK